MAKEAHTAPEQPELATQRSDYAITITDCNSITEAQITLRRESRVHSGVLGGWRRDATRRAGCWNLWLRLSMIVACVRCVRVDC